MVSVFSLIVYSFTLLFFLPTKSNFIHQDEEKRKLQNDVAEFDVAERQNRSLNKFVQQAKNIGRKLESQLGRGYEFLGHKVADFGTELEDNKDNLAEKAADIYTGPFANKTGVVYEKFQYGSGTVGDGLSSVLNWFGQTVLRMGHVASSVIRSSFHLIGNILGDTVDKTEQFVGDGLIKTSEKVHESAIELQHSSHNDSETLRHKLQKSSPQFEQSLSDAIGNLGDNLHSLGVNTEQAGEILEKHRFLDTIKQASQD